MESIRFCLKGGLDAATGRTRSHTAPHTHTHWHTSTSHLHCKIRAANFFLEPSRKESPPLGGGGADSALFLCQLPVAWAGGRGLCSKKNELVYMP